VFPGLHTPIINILCWLAIWTSPLEDPRAIQGNALQHVVTGDAGAVEAYSLMEASLVPVIARDVEIAPALFVVFHRHITRFLNQLAASVHRNIVHIIQGVLVAVV